MKPVTWNEKADEFLGHLGAERSSEAYRNNVKAVLRRFGERIGGKDPAEVMKADVNAWLADLNGTLAPSTVGGYLTILKAAFRWWAREDEWEGPETPACVRGLKLAGVRETRLKDPAGRLTEEDHRALLSVMTPDKALIFRLLWDTGARAGEVLRLRRENLDFRADGKVVTLGFVKTKNGSPRPVPVVNRETISILRARWEITPPGGFLFESPVKPGKPLRVAGLWRYLQRARDRAHVEKPVWLHLYRNAATRRFRALGTDLRNRMEGWREGSPMGSRYDVLDTDDLTEALLELEGEPEPSAGLSAEQLAFAAMLTENPDIGELLQAASKSFMQALSSSPETLEKLQAVVEKVEAVAPEFVQGVTDKAEWDAAIAEAKRNQIMPGLEFIRTIPAEDWKAAMTEAGFGFRGLFRRRKKS